MKKDKTKSLRLTFVFGTRPETIKMAPIIREASRRGHRVRVITTGQHRQMVKPLLKFFGIKPTKDLNLMKVGQTPLEVTSKVISSLDRTLKSSQSDYVLVQGDTSSAFAAAFWAFHHKVPVVHVEAGLRTYDLNSPFPEEGNRQLISRIASLHFAPTSSSVEALKAEGISEDSVFNVGNSGIDALRFSLEEADLAKVPAGEKLSPKILNWIGHRKLVLVTAHRRESFGEGFKGIVEGIRRLADSRDDLAIVFPVHPNPNVQKPVKAALGKHSRILLCAPQPYIAFVQLMARADVLLTDSGGVQEEGPSLRKPILVMRDSTERPEGVAAGFAKLVKTDPDAIVREALKVLENPEIPSTSNPYGDGRTALKILESLEKFAKPRQL